MGLSKENLVGWECHSSGRALASDVQVGPLAKQSKKKTTSSLRTKAESPRKGVSVGKDFLRFLRLNGNP